MNPPIERGGLEWQVRDALLGEQITALIETAGFAMLPVFAAEPDGIPFCYTIGMTGLGLPEILVALLDSATAFDLLRSAVSRHRDQAFSPGESWVLDQTDPPVLLKAVALPRGTPCLGTAYRYYQGTGHAVTGIQLILPDDDGRYPGDPGYGWGPQAVF